jgi:hypothetical protein
MIIYLKYLHNTSDKDQKIALRRRINVLVAILWLHLSLKV